MHEEDLKSMKDFAGILEKDLRKEIKRITEAGTMTPADVKTVTDAICLMLKEKEYESWLEENSYADSSHGMRVPYHPNSFGPARSSVTGRYMSRGMEPYAEDRYPSYGRTRYDMGYSGHSTKDRMIAALEDTMGEAKNEYEMNMIRETINRIQSGN